MGSISARGCRNRGPVAHSANRKISRHRNAPSYYDVLQVTPTVTASEIEASWKRLVRENHPDRTTEDRRPEANERTAAINEAYQALCDPARRARYDSCSGINTMAGVLATRVPQSTLKRRLTLSFDYGASDGENVNE